MKRLTLFAALFIFLSAAVAQAQMWDCGRPSGPGMRHHDRGPGHGPGDGGFGLLQCKDELNLTDEQEAKIKDINYDFQKGMIDMKAEMQKVRLDKQHEMRLDNPDKGKVLLLTKELNNIRGKMSEARVEHRFALRDVLTKEQIDKLNECRAQCHKRDGRGPRFDSPDDDARPGKGSRGRR